MHMFAKCHLSVSDGPFEHVRCLTAVRPQVCLMSRDMQNVLVTTFCELKQCFERSFRELFEASVAKDPPAS